MALAFSKGIPCSWLIFCATDLNPGWDFFFFANWLSLRQNKRRRGCLFQTLPPPPLRVGDYSLSYVTYVARTKNNQGNRSGRVAPLEDNIDRIRRAVSLGEEGRGSRAGRSSGAGVLGSDVVVIVIPITNIYSR